MTPIDLTAIPFALHEIIIVSTHRGLDERYRVAVWHPHSASHGALKSRHTVAEDLTLTEAHLVREEVLTIVNVARRLHDKEPI